MAIRGGFVSDSSNVGGETDMFEVGDSATVRSVEKPIEIRGETNKMLKKQTRKAAALAAVAAITVAVLGAGWHWHHGSRLAGWAWDDSAAVSQAAE